MDYSRLSTETLQKLAKGQALDYATLPHQDLEILSGKEPGVIDEEHPDIHFMDRALLENFADPAHKLTYLKDHYPNLEAKLDPADQSKVLLRSPHEFNYHVLAPSFSPISHPLNTLADLPKKLLDNSADLASGAGAGAAMGAGAVAGAPLGPLGSYGAASSAGGAVSAAGEYAKQKIGQALGLRKDVEGDRVAAAGIGGAVAPYLFGAGEAAPGALGLARSKLAPALGEFFSGVPKKAISTTIEDTAGVNALNDPNEKLNFIKSLTKTVKAAVTSPTNAVGGAIEEVPTTLAAQGARIPLQPARDPIEAYLSKLEASQAAHPAPATQAKIQETQALLDEFGFHAPPEPASTPLLEGMGLTPEEVEKALTNAGETPQMVRPPPPEDIDPHNALDIARDLKRRANASNLYRAGANDTIHDIGLRQAAKEAGQNLTSALSDASDGELGNLNASYSANKKDYSQKGKSILERLFGRNFEADPQQIAGRLSNLANDSRAADRAMVEGIDAKYGTDIVKAADLLHANKFMGKPALFPVSNKGTTSTTRTLVTAGLAGAGGATGHLTTAPLAALSSPMVQKGLIRATNPIAAAARNNPEALYSILNASGALSGAGGAATGIGKTAWDKLQEYIGGQK